jgi:hypothetical protein
MGRAAAPVIADSVQPSAAAMLQHVVAQRAPKDFSLKARLFLTREKTIPATLLVHNSTNGTATLFRAGTDELLVIQPVAGPVRFFRPGHGEITGVDRARPFAGSHFAIYDLGLPFLRWPDVKLTGEQQHRSRDCSVIEAQATGEPYARVRLWIDKEFAALLRAEGYDESGNLVKRLAVTSFKKIGGLWVPRGLEAADVPVGQSLPAQEKSRLEVYEGDYDAQLPAEWFAPPRN